MLQRGEGLLELPSLIYIKFSCESTPSIFLTTTTSTTRFLPSVSRVLILLSLALTPGSVWYSRTTFERLDPQCSIGDL